MRMAASLFGSENPKNASAVTMPTGGTRPMREPGGKIGSAARAGAARSISASAVARPAAALRIRNLLSVTMQSLCCRSGSRRFARAPRDSAQGQIDPSPFREQARSGRIDSIDTVEGKAGAAAEDEYVARAEAEGVGGLVPLQSADAKQAAIAERNRNHRRSEILLVAVLMQTHFRGRGVEVDQTGLRRVRIAGQLVP